MRTKHVLAFIGATMAYFAIAALSSPMLQGLM